METTWLEDLGVWVDEQIGDRRVAARFREKLLLEGKRDYRTLKNGAPNDGKTTTQDEEFPPRRRMRLGEKYRFVSAIHDAECQDTTQVWRWFCRGKAFSPEDEPVALYASVAIQRDAHHKVRDLRADQFQRILGIFADVATDLGVNPPKVERAATVQAAGTSPGDPTPLSVADPINSLDGYLPADTLALEHGCVAARLSEGKMDGKIRWKSAPSGYRDSQGKPVRVLYHKGDALKHATPRGRRGTAG